MGIDDASRKPKKDTKVRTYTLHHIWERGDGMQVCIREGCQYPVWLDSELRPETTQCGIVATLPSSAHVDRDVVDFTALHRNR